MSLFTSATSGVDPQTGSYLSKEQRVAMFQSSRGRGGGGSATPEGKRGKVAPQNAIVVANKMAQVVQTLQTNTQETVQAVNVKVQENAQNIENLYKSVQNNRSAEAKEEKAETKDLRADRENALRAGKEKLIEGMSSAVAGLVGVGKRAADAALKPVMGFWEKIKGFLLNIAAAWAIKNLPIIMGYVEDFVSWLGDFKSWLPKSLTGLRGVWSIADNIIRAMWRGFSRIGGTIFRIATWLTRKLFSLLKRIFAPIGRFVSRIVGGIVDFLRPIVSRALRGLGDALGGIGNSINRAFGGGGSSSGLGGVKGGAGVEPGQKAIAGAAEEGGGLLSGIRKFFKGLGDKGKAAFTKGQELFASGGKKIQQGIGAIQETTTGVKPQPEKHAGWLKKALTPIGDLLPGMKGALSGIGKLINGVLKVVPGIGFAIDLALNKGINGDDWTTAIVAALGSSVAGGIGIAGGAKIGGGVGFALGTAIPGIGNIVGAAIGAGLGGIIGGIAGGALGDTAARMGLDALNIGESAQSENKPADIGSPGGAMDLEGGAHETVPASSVGATTNNNSTSGMVSSATSGSSTPEGMSEPNGGNTTSVETINLAPNVVDSGKEDSSGKLEVPSMIDDNPFWQTSDPASDMYRSFASTEYELVH
ncbi:hypothetical protein Syn7803US43_10 [Synechococcus phage ACG-2014f]|uniref:Uncharacterized protein n=1 Tax=Synechococcus phage ACG-2014f TaxID=1493511 RepID=A0A0E3HQZ4_9CAUD|nr:hypothetical protein Syn7803US43_10 [Synechococcus phage ACG-2014f]